MTTKGTAESTLSRRTFCALAGAGTFALGLGLAGCGQDAADDEAGSAVDSDEARAVEKASTGDYVLRDRKSIYADDDEDSVVVMYLTVRRGNSGESTDHTWEEINAHSKYWYEEQGVAQYACEAILQIGDETGPLPEQLGYTALAPNATVKIRGQSSTYYSQKNYKIALKKDKGSWRDQTVINLNKHQQEGMRFRNKLAFDLLKMVPQMTSCRTQFVHLYVCDQTQDGTNAVFEDYGLYTQVEQLSKTYLKNHDMDRYGQLYKIESFEYYRYPEALKLKTDPTYDEAVFNEVLESKGNDDHTKLLAMLDEVNDYATPIEDTLAKWFDVDNLVYWMAFHMLVGNYDVQSRNGFLYSPQNIEKFFVLSWDNDGCLFRKEWEVRGRIEGTEWERGASNYWGMVLFNRALRLPDFRAALDAAVEDLLANYLGQEHLEEMIRGYRETVEPFVYAQPDMLSAPLTAQEYDVVAQAIPEEVQLNYESYLESLQKPMPFYISTPVLEDGELALSWDASYDFDGEMISYRVTLARDPDLADVVATEDDLIIPQLSVDDPGEGQYFLKVEATNESGYTQVAFDTYVRTDDTALGKAYGTLCFYIMADGSVVLDGGYVDEDSDAGDVEGADESAEANDTEGAGDSGAADEAANAGDVAEADVTKGSGDSTEADRAKDAGDVAAAEGAAAAGGHESAEDASDVAETDDSQAVAQPGATKAGEGR